MPDLDDIMKLLPGNGEVKAWTEVLPPPLIRSTKYMVVKLLCGGAAVLSDARVFNTRMEARKYLEMKAKTEFRAESGWAEPKWTNGDTVEFSRKDYPSSLVYKVKGVFLEDVYTSVVKVPVFVHCKASCVEDAAKEAERAAKEAFSSARVKKALGEFHIQADPAHVEVSPDTTECII